MLALCNAVQRFVALADTMDYKSKSNLKSEAMLNTTAELKVDADSTVFETLFEESPTKPEPSFYFGSPVK